MGAGYSRSTTLQALATDKATLSHLLERTSRQPANIFGAISPAPTLQPLRGQQLAVPGSARQQSGRWIWC